MKNGVVVLSPSPYSLYTTCVVELLKRSDVMIRGICVRRLLNPRRLFEEFRANGTRLLMERILRKVVLRDRTYGEVNFETLADFRRRLNISFTSVAQVARAYKIPVITCNTLNDQQLVETLSEFHPRVVIFTGGGIIRNPLLQRSGAGIINCHIGVLPHYRGMDCIEWPVLENRWDHFGLTTHFMDAGIDTGPIVRRRYLDLLPGDTFEKIRDRCEPIMCSEVVDVTLSILDGTFRPEPQYKEAGRQYFRMHPRLKRVAELELERVCEKL